MVSTVTGGRFSSSVYCWMINFLVDLFLQPLMGCRLFIFRCLLLAFSLFDEEWSGGAKVLGELSVPGSPTRLDDSRANAY